MKVKGKIQFLFNKDISRLCITDKNASVRMLEIDLNPDQIAEMLGRSTVECEMEVGALDKVGRIMEVKRFHFQIDPSLKGSKYTEELHQLCLEKLSETGQSDWIPDKYCGSQDSFYRLDGKTYAKTVIRRWVDADQAD